MSGRPAASTAIEVYEPTVPRESTTVTVQLAADARSET
jgi:hypothetical protein